MGHRREGWTTRGPQCSWLLCAATQAGIPSGFPFLSLAHRATTPKGLVLERGAQEMAEQAQKRGVLAQEPLGDPRSTSPGLEGWADLDGPQRRPRAQYPPGATHT